MYSRNLIAAAVAIGLYGGFVGLGLFQTIALSVIVGLLIMTEKIEGK